MHRRHGRINIPIEIIRTIVAIADTGSFSKAGSKLGLSQPAISAQVKRLQSLVGGTVFQRTPGGVSFTPLGELVLSHARKLLEANDQILLIGGVDRDTAPIRLGLSTIYINDYFNASTGQTFADRVNIYCAHSVEIATILRDGHLDIASLLSPPATYGNPVFEWQESLVWVRSPNFVLSPGAPVPLICWPGSVAYQPMIQALERQGLAYRVAFSSYDHYARIAAADAGVGLIALPERFVPESLVVGRDYYLPAMKPMRAGICVRPNLPRSKLDPVVEVLKTLAPDESRISAA